MKATTTAISRGDRAALAVFYESWFDRCFALARSLTARDESFCLDIVQDTMLRVIRRLPPIDTAPELDSWMTLATHSSAIDLLRRESRRLHREARRGRAEAEPQAASADDRIAWIIARLRDLPPDDGAMLAMRLGQDRTLAAVGAAAGISDNAAHGRVRRAMDKLRRWAKESGHE